MKGVVSDREGGGGEGCNLIIVNRLNFTERKQRWATYLDLKDIFMHNDRKKCK